MKRVGRFRERQYQLAAQKQYEAFLKHEYYQQTARYFERECRNAKHYDSWNYKNVDPKGEFEKAKKAERLLIRRNKLRSLLKEEEETYKREVEERNRPKSRPEESSLELLKQKLKEKRAEQSLYLPRTCRRYQSYFFSPKDPIDPRWNTLRDTNLRYPRICRDSTNLVCKNDLHPYQDDGRMSENERRSSKENLETQQEISRPLSSEYSSYFGRPNPPFSARYERRSLENTNVRGDDFVDYVPSRMSRRSSPCSSTGRYDSSSIEAAGYGDSKKNRKEDRRLKSCQEDDSVIERRSAGSKDDRLVATKDFTPRHEDYPGQVNEENNSLEKSSMERSNADDSVRRAEPSTENSVRVDRDQVDKYSGKEDQGEEDMKTKDNRQFEVEKSLPWLRMNPNDKNLSKQMFLYLTHKELKCKIDDLARRELHACNKQYWDEALRLRDMKNRLELIREKELYNLKNLDLDEEVRKQGLLNVNKREVELAERENICMDSTMYSEDAKTLWKKWVHEDERFVIKDARVQREKLMNSLEKEWQNLAIRDKERISRTYQSVLTDSTLQEEHKLAAAINMTRMKSFPNSLK